MTWAAPRTWIAGEMVTAALLNADIWGNLESLNAEEVGGWVELGRTTLTGTSDTIGPITLDQGYRHVMGVLNAANTGTAIRKNHFLRINSDGASNYGYNWGYTLDNSGPALVRLLDTGCRLASAASDDEDFVSTLSTFWIPNYAVVQPHAILTDTFMSFGAGAAGSFVTSGGGHHKTSAAVASVEVVIPGFLFTEGTSLAVYGFGVAA